MPRIPRLGERVVMTSSSVADMHVKALSTPASIGKRIIGCDRFIWFIDMAKTRCAHRAVIWSTTTSRNDQPFIARQRIMLYSGVHGELTIAG